MVTQANKIAYLLNEIAEEMYRKAVSIMDLYVEDGENVINLSNTAFVVFNGEWHSCWVFRNEEESSIKSLKQKLENLKIEQIKSGWKKLNGHYENQKKFTKTNPRVTELNEALEFIKYGIEPFEEIPTDEELEDVEEI